MRVLHVCFCSYTLLTRNRVLYSVVNGNKSTDAAHENWGPGETMSYGPAVTFDPGIVTDFR
jgi:hypothetical protein